VELFQFLAQQQLADISIESPVLNTTSQTQNNFYTTSKGRKKNL
jgi:hypothetical protein